MKKMSLLPVLVLFAVLLNQCTQEPKQVAKGIPGSKLEVLYFHATNRCPTCLAVENNTKQLLEREFRQELEKGNLKFTSLNIEDEVNKSLVEKYEIGFSTLLIVRPDGEVVDFTNTAFQYARNEPEKYDELLKSEIAKNLN